MSVTSYPDSPNFAIYPPPSLSSSVTSSTPTSLSLGLASVPTRTHTAPTTADPHLSSAGLSLPIQYTYDDHEILNDAKGRELESFETAVDVWREYAGSSNMGTPLPDADLTQNNADGFVPAHFAMDAGPACIFVMDTRGFREGKSVLGGGQMAQVKSWLLRSKGVCPFKILASPVPVTPNYSHVEGWGGSDDLAQILTFTDENAINGTVFISGDSHMQGVYEIAPGVLEISSSPTSAQGPPLQTINGYKGQVVGGQVTIGQHCSE